MSDWDDCIILSLILAGAVLVFGTGLIWRDWFSIEIIRAVLWTGIALKLSGFGYLLIRFLWVSVALCRDVLLPYLRARRV
jgi:hypothetical protein